MVIAVLNELAQLIEHKESILAIWRTQVRELPAARNLDLPTLNDHIPVFLDELAAALRSASNETIAHAIIVESPPAHGIQRVKDAFDIEEVVAEYNILRGCIHDLAERNGLALQGKPFRILNRVFDGAIGSAVQAFAIQKALEVQQKREDYLAFVAHDLRTPLSAISLSTHLLSAMLRQNGTETPQISQVLKTLDRNINYLTVLASEILEENSNLETEMGTKLERRKFDLWPLVEGLVHDLHPIAGTASTQLINNIPDDLTVYADANLLRRIFQNLIANAIEHTPSGEIVIEANESEDKSSVECIVRDNGVGILAERFQTIFNKHETDSKKEGLGLGLAIVKTFLEAHESAVTVESEIGVGTIFRFSLPSTATKNRKS